MGVENPNVVDFVSTGDDYVQCSVVDALNWSDEAKHLEVLQKKLNNYLDFIDEGQIFLDYPNAKNVRKIEIKVYFQFAPTTEAVKFLGLVKNHIETSGSNGLKYIFSYEVIPDDIKN